MVVSSVLTLGGAGCVLFTSLEHLEGGQPAAPDAGDAGDAGADAQADRAGPPGRYTDVVMADKPALYWRLGEAAGASIAADQSGNTNPGTYMAGTLGTAGLIAGDSDTALSLPGGAGIAVRGGQRVGSLQTSFTLEAWVKADSFVAGWLVRRRNPGSGNSIGLAFVSGEMRFYVSSAELPFTLPPKARSTMHFVGTWDGIAMRLFMDGELVATQNAPGIESTGGSPVDLGEQMAGSLDEVAVYATALPPDRIRAHYTAGTAP